ncbi:unnamed protein product [Somion occarium]|uniref:F-box domain-containing protein n=1 Tax=Somion occarium TaxID=3059160 RepID=A0ABP1DP64_9APHY
MSSPSSSTNPESNASSSVVGPRRRPAEDSIDKEKPTKRPHLTNTDSSANVKPDGRPDGNSSLSSEIVKPLKRPADDSQPEQANPGVNSSRAIKRIRLEGEVDPAVEQQKHSTSSVTARRKRPLAEDGCDKLSPDPGDNRPPAKRVRVKGVNQSNKTKKQCDDALLLPIELHHEILEWLWVEGSFEDNRYYLVKTLRACARTCSRWRSAARPHIFRFLKIKSPSRFNDLVALIEVDPQVAGWIQKVGLDGISIPYRDDVLRPRLGSVDEDRDRWMYGFPSSLGVPLPSLKCLELTGFAHLSKKREDQEAFAGWIRQLAELRSVVELNMVRCEMSSNSLTAMVRAFPKLVRVGFASVDFTAPNIVSLRDETPSPKPASKQESSEAANSEVACVDKVSVPPMPDDTKGIPPSSHDVPTLSVEYPLFHPPPVLQSFMINNMSTDFLEFDFLLVRDWLRPEILNRSLKSLDIDSFVDGPTLAKFIASLGMSPALECLIFYVGNGRQGLIDSAVNIHNLSNLTSIRFVTHEVSEREDVEAIHYILSQLNAPRLQSISISIPYPDGFEMFEGTDEYLAKEFGGIKELCVETFTDTPAKTQKAREGITAMFPLLAERGILRVENWGLPYLC